MQASGHRFCSLKMAQVTHPHDALMGYGTLITVLVGIHVAALVFWMVMTVLGNRTPKGEKSTHQD